MVVTEVTGRIQVRKSVWAVEPHEFNGLQVQADLIECDEAINE